MCCGVYVIEDWWGGSCTLGREKTQARNWIFKKSIKNSKKQTETSALCMEEECGLAIRLESFHETRL